MVLKMSYRTNLVIVTFLMLVVYNLTSAFVLVNQTVKISNISIPALRVYSDPPCPSEIYCHGRLLHTVQMAHIYNDSKTFVDMKLKDTADNTLAKFDAFMVQSNNAPTKEALKSWVEGNFDPVGSEFEPWKPDDWKENPRFMERIEDTNLKQWAKDLNQIWLQLGRKMKPDVKVGQQ
jgi:alpha,alpha-trehalase